MINVQVYAKKIQLHHFILAEWVTDIDYLRITWARAWVEEATRSKTTVKHSQNQVLTRV